MTSGSAPMAKAKKTPRPSTSPSSGGELWHEHPWDIRDDVVLVRVRVTPRGGKNAVEGCDILADGSQVVKVRTSAAPQDGEANESVRKTLARALDLPASSISLESGATSRIKVFCVKRTDAGLDEKLLAL